MESDIFSSPDDNQKGDEQDSAERLQDYLNACATNLIQRSIDGDLPVAYRRDEEVEQILASLASPLRGRIVLTGGPRVGKTAVVNEVSRRIQQGKCPDVLQGAQVWALSARSILRAFGVSGWQMKLGELMAAWQSHPEVILYLDALPTTLLAGATHDDPLDMAQFLLGQLQSSDSRILTEGRTSAVNMFLEAYPEYKYVLLDIKINEPEMDVARQIVGKAGADLERQQEVTIDDGAIDVAIDLTRRFTLNERLPGKAIDLLSEVVALNSERVPPPPVTAERVINRYSERTGLPHMMLTDEEPYDEAEVRRYFNDRVLGQEQATDAVVQALSLLRTRMNNPRRPMGVFLFMGPTGVGKTELARTLSTFLFGSEESIVRFNMADYTLEWHLQVLFGNPHGYDAESRRGQLTMRLQDRAFSVILLDEFEKAHPLIFQRFLQLFDEGLLINGASEVVNMRNAIIIMTSNFGARELESVRLGFSPVDTLEQREERILEETVRFFTPEFVNRIDNVLFFKPLTRLVLREIAYRQIQQVLRREGLMRRNLTIEVEEDVVEWVVQHGYSHRYGARYLNRQIEKTITYPLARQVIQHAPPDGALMRLFVHNDRVVSALVLPSASEPAGEMERVAPPRPELADIATALPMLAERVAALEGEPHVREARSRLGDLMRAMATPTFWDSPNEVQTLMDQLNTVSAQVELVDSLQRNLDELSGIVARLAGGNDAESQDGFADAVRRYRYLAREVPGAELTVLLSEPTDFYSAHLYVQSKGSSAAARAWAAELARMYVQWAQRRGFTVNLVGEVKVTARASGGFWLKIGGYGATGLLRGEQGTHRRVSSAKAKDGSQRRVTTQAVVMVWPDPPDGGLLAAAGDMPKIKVESISPVKGALGEQLARSATVERNKAKSDLSLTSPLSAELLQRELAKLVYLAGDDGLPPFTANHALWSQGVRAYVKHKGNYAEDLRTGERVKKLKAVMAGEIDAFLEGWLRHQQQAPAET